MTKDEDGAICIKMQISPDNPTIYDIPIEEFFEDYIGRDVLIEVLPVETWRRSDA
ncbi:MAG: hypothetical protein ACTSWN_10830 [Promethearchaeota archaeon]